MLHLDWILAIAAAWLVIGFLGLAWLRRFRIVAQVLFPLGAAGGLALAVVAGSAIFATPEVAVLPIGLPQLPFHLRLDSLSAFFLAVLGVTTVGISAFAAGYFRHGEGTPPGLLCLEYHAFLASMALLLVADDAFAFMVLWEAMALSSYFLVIANHRIAEIRRAGFLYLLMAHVGAIALLLCFGVLQANTGDYTFANLRAQQLAPAWAGAAFLLALAGFGAKAGAVPLHVWLPEAHPAAPSPVSALMSAVMLKTAIYGLLRITFDVLPMQPWWWGALLLALGLLTAIFGVLFSAVQTDMKRLLAYSSIENIGLLLAGIGLAILFKAHGMVVPAALALTAALYHVASHALFKSLLFLGTGSVLHATGERNLGRLGGLVRPMPWVAWTMLFGALASAGLPPLGGFVSEWLLLQGFLFSPQLPPAYLSMLVPVGAAAVALVSALAGYVMVKFFGVVFLGQPREPALAQARDARPWERAGLAWLVACGLAVGLFPVPLIAAIDPVTRVLVGSGIGEAARAHGWLLLVPTSVARASYGPLVFLVVVGGGCAAAWLVVRRAFHEKLRRSAPWDCGFGALGARMQDTAEGFGQPIRQIFEPFFRLERVLPTPFDAQPRYRVTIEDHAWHALYLPIAAVVERIARRFSALQQGRISVYLLYSFLTLLAMLMVIRSWD
ncbi:MAG TPA: hydrogenase 4 subunit B [Burkholderiaceae bacterium]|nr:hydrogenase 4 subunit B [Burkholderiaceae bacterium]